MQLTEAINLVEQWRHTLGIEEALPMFIYSWAYRQTGLYCPENPYDDHPEFNRIASALCPALSTLMMDGYHDPIGDLLTHFNLRQSHSLWLDDGDNILQYDSPTQGNQTLYDLKMGTGGLLMMHLVQHYKRGTITQLEVVGEEQDSLCCAAAVLQLIFFTEHISNKYLGDDWPKYIAIRNIHPKAQAPYNYYLKTE
uniref:hypothetical protein n=1 Tax=Thaumasiovibrio occultus TaxID=1891184 RepID=UPI000B3619FF|nr:hypothetical protein [Thaumasiovibrio occultus]